VAADVINSVQPSMGLLFRNLLKCESTFKFLASVLVTTEIKRLVLYVSSAYLFASNPMPTSKSYLVTNT
jgi:hypothetical protein